FLNVARSRGAVRRRLSVRQCTPDHLRMAPETQRLLPADAAADDHHTPALLEHHAVVLLQEPQRLGRGDADVVRAVAQAAFGLLLAGLVARDADAARGRERITNTPGRG